jgi:hypothetical protein
MRLGLRTYLPVDKTLRAGRIDYKKSRRINPEAARRAVMEYLKTNGHHVSQTAAVFRVNRPVIYDIITKDKEGDLRDRSRVPKHQLEESCRPKRTPAPMEDIVVSAKNKTRLGPERLSRYLKQYEDITVPAGTIRHILRRNKKRLNSHLPHRVRKEKREFVDWYSAKPFEIVQVDLKYIRDHKALTKEQLVHLDQYNIPNYQWSALDVNSRFKLIAYSREKS